MTNILLGSVISRVITTRQDVYLLILSNTIWGIYCLTVKKHPGINRGAEFKVFRIRRKLRSNLKMKRLSRRSLTNTMNWWSSTKKSTGIESDTLQMQINRMKLIGCSRLWTAMTLMINVPLMPKRSCTSLKGKLILNMEKTHPVLHPAFTDLYIVNLKCHLR